MAENHSMKENSHYHIMASGSMEEGGQGHSLVQEPHQRKIKKRKTQETACFTKVENWVQTQGGKEGPNQKCTSAGGSNAQRYR